MRAKQEIKLAENLKRILSEQNRSFTSTAKQVGMNKSTLHGYCNGVIPRNLTQLKDLAEFLEVSLTDLIFGRVNEEPKIRGGNAIEGRYEVIIRRVDDLLKDTKR